MKNFFKYIGVIGICILSFYYTNIISEYVKSQNPLYKEIKLQDKMIPSIDSVINDNYIIPGISGKKVDIDKSFSNMHKENKYDETLLVYKEIKPNISLDNNKDKIIIRGNSNKNKVSIIFDSKNELYNYMIENNYHINLLINKEEYNDKVELINNSNNENTYNKIDKFLNKKKLNKNLCLINKTIPTYCNNKYLFNISLTINHSNISTTINQISNGEIIKIENSITKEELLVILQSIKYKNLEIEYLSKLISETN